MAIMKNTGMLWLGQIPVDWELGKVKYAFNRKKEKSTEKDPTVLSLARTGVKVRDISTNEGQLAASYEGYNPVEPNDLLLNPMDLVSGANCSISKVSGVISPAYVNLRAKIGFEPRYYDYYFKTQYWNMGFFAHGKGVSFENRWTLNDATLKDYYIPMPLLSEQQTIADYLDETCSKIDEIIAEAKASIDEYKELKQSVIFEAVTKGLDKNVEFIDSGDEWLGEYPKSYNIGQLSMLSNIVRGGSPRPAGDPRYYGGNISFMRISDITKDDNIYVNSCENTITEEGLTRTRMIPPNTLLLTNSGATLGVPKINTFETAFNDGIAAFLDLDERLNIVYVYFFLKARTSYFLECASMGMGQPNLNTDIIGRTKIVFPTLVEQQNVVSYLEDRCGKLNSLISEKESLIKDLESYKKSLIYEVVTGKRRVV